MPARDKFHESAKVSLEKEGWTITDDPLHIRFDSLDMYIDLAAEQLLAAEKQGRKIAVEIKSFTAPSLMAEFHTAIGQFVNYKNALQETEPQRQLYLAITEDVYKSFFSLPFVQMVVAREKVRLIVYNIGQEVITLWQE